jgi:hypothetical protein
MVFGDQSCDLITNLRKESEDVSVSEGLYRVDDLTS